MPHPLRTNYALTVVNKSTPSENSQEPWIYLGFSSALKIVPLKRIQTSWELSSKVYLYTPLPDQPVLGSKKKEKGKRSHTQPSPSLHFLKVMFSVFYFHIKTFPAAADLALSRHSSE